MDRYFGFNPWMQTDGLEPNQDISYLVQSPPCANCKHWKPVVEDELDHEDRGIILCHSDKQYNDFSCYEYKGRN